MVLSQASLQIIQCQWSKVSCAVKSNIFIWLKATRRSATTDTHATNVLKSNVNALPVSSVYSPLHQLSTQV